MQTLREAGPAAAAAAGGATTTDARFVGNISRCVLTRFHLVVDPVAARLEGSGPPCVPGCASLHACCLIMCLIMLRPLHDPVTSSSCRWHRFLNHSCSAANVRSVSLPMGLGHPPRLVFMTHDRPVRRGEELLLDYFSTEDFKVNKAAKGFKPCLCGSTFCRKFTL